MSKVQSVEVLSWNANGLKLCENKQDVADYDRIRLYGLLRLKYSQPCIEAKFTSFYNDVKSKKPTLAYISTQDEADNNTYFHHSYLIRVMDDIGYTLLHREKVTTKKLKNKKSTVTGTVSKLAMRSSLYINNDYLKMVLEKKSTINTVYSHYGNEDSHIISDMVNVDSIVYRFNSVSIPHGFNEDDIANTLDLANSVFYKHRPAVTITCGEIDVNKTQHQVVTATGTKGVTVTGAAKVVKHEGMQEYTSNEHSIVKEGYFTITKK